MKPNMSPPLHRLRELLAYDPVTGALTWIVYRNSKCRPGSTAGYIGPTGYRIVEIEGKAYAAHRIAFILHSGSDIADGLEIDHKDGVRDNNAADNLRAVTTSGNAQNRKLRSDNSSGYVGVSWHRQTQKWWAQIDHEGRRISLGLHATPEAASKAYLKAKKDLHPIQPVPR
ncbi:HNH endonuclease [Stenotrophomonas maltophilia]|uniref:HNH endonuclease n=1 Tax=Stenotrophomonas maltophilia TaxID=40324 RepID=UPI0013904D49|nr:HNH endonuclease [Stenotrophomonas maltophilia]